ncbi:MAG: hypothetical protein IPQ07_42690 [Myxococcales bacterium]|nr:hypothetical protein [Myxococcales bacterium]
MGVAVLEDMNEHLPNRKHDKSDDLEIGHKHPQSLPPKQPELEDDEPAIEIDEENRITQRTPAQRARDEEPVKS